ncbi:MAG: ParB/RepB/Spo0J family partition protein [Parvibaculales bacterium]
MSDRKPQAQKPGGKKTATRNPGRGLGRGLSALIGDAAPTPVAVMPSADPGQSATKAADSGLRYVGIDELKAGAFQPRKNFAKEELDALAASVEKSGVLQPLLVRPCDDGFEIIAGERRWRAAQQARLHQVPVIVQPVNDVTALEIGLVENVQRADLNPVEEAEGYQRLIDEFAYTQAELAETIGKSRSHIANLLRLSGAPSVIRQALIDGTLSMGHARALLGLQNPEKHAAALITQIVKSGMSVRAVEKLVAAQSAIMGKSPTATRRGASEKSADTRQLEKQLADALGLTVALDDKGKKGGELRIGYKTLEQLDGLMARLLRG